MATVIKFLKKKKFKNAVMITGLPGIGLVGKICVDYLLKQLKTEKVAEIYSDSFPPSVYTKDSIVELIKDEMFASNVKGTAFIFLAGPVQPSLDMAGGFSEEHYEFAETVVGACQKLGVKRIFTLAGINIGSARMNKDPEVVVAATSKKALKDFVDVGGKADTREGLISGAAGLLLGIAKEKGMDGACLMGETNANLVYGDHGAAKRVLALLVQKFGFTVDMSRIEKESKEIEKAFAELSKQLEIAQQEEVEADSDEDLTYVR
ncbi:MAG: PAC2 family protein [Candidatus Diapherotrites archaeon]|nr:PAC2 family protein [Candidatus Diapherotrites archaeon]